MAVHVRSMLDEAAHSHRKAQRRLAELEQILQAARRRRDAAATALERDRSRCNRSAGVVQRLRALLQGAQGMSVVSAGGQSLDLQQMRQRLKHEKVALKEQQGALERLDQHKRRLCRLQEAVRHLPSIPDSLVQQRIAAMRTRHACAKADKQASEALLGRWSTLIAGLRGLLHRAKAVVMPNFPASGTDSDLKRLRQRHATEQALLMESQHAVQSQAAQTVILRQVVDGAAAMGMGSYLARASPDAKVIIQEIHRKACDEGKSRVGRRPQSAVDNEAETKRRRKAQRERERRHAAKQLLAALPEDQRKSIEAERKARHGADRRKRRQVEVLAPDPVLDGSRPRHRQHETRIKNAEPHKKALMTARILTARERGHAAAIRDANARQQHAAGAWSNPHAARKLPDGCKLIAVRGGRGDPDETMSSILEPGGLEMWLKEPAAERAMRMNGRARLVHVAGHITAAWADILKDMARTGTSLEEAAAYRVDEAIARLDLAGHRVAAYWHTDSATGHPHLHIVWARVRDSDLSLWSLESRSRATALWLHARSNTVIAAGHEALRDDVDALGGFSDAAVDAEVMLANDDIVAHRRLIDGICQEIPLQGGAAVGRVARLGVGPTFLAGGMWLFGLGPDPDRVRVWKKALAAAKQSGDKQRIKAVIADRPNNRGYWLPLRGEVKGLEDVLASDSFGDYLSRRRK
jgi:hypothetical protein